MTPFLSTPAARNRAEGSRTLRQSTRLVNSRPHNLFPLRRLTVFLFYSRDRSAATPHRGNTPSLFGLSMERRPKTGPRLPQPACRPRPKRINSDTKPATATVPTSDKLNAAFRSQLEPRAVT